MRSRRRTYESPLRAEQMDRTRDKLVEAGIDLLVDAGSEELTVRAVAARARISVPTAYRYFPDRDSLLDALSRTISDRMQMPSFAKSLDEMPDFVTKTYANFETNDRIMRAQIKSPTGRTIRAKHKKQRDELTVAAVAASLPAMSAKAQRRLAAMIRSLININTWVSLNDDWGMNGTEASNTIRWVIDAMIAEAKRHPQGLEADTPQASQSATGQPVSSQPAAARGGRARRSNPSP